MLVLGENDKLFIELEWSAAVAQLIELLANNLKSKGFNKSVAVTG